MKAGTSHPPNEFHRRERRERRNALCPFFVFSVVSSRYGSKKIIELPYTEDYIKYNLYTLLKSKECPMLTNFKQIEEKALHSEQKRFIVADAAGHAVVEALKQATDDGMVRVER